MNTHTAEHQKISALQNGQNYAFSSPFGFSGGEGQAPGPPSGPAPAPPPSGAAPYSGTAPHAFGPPPPFVDGCFGMYYQEWKAPPPKVVMYEVTVPVQMPQYQQPPPQYQQPPPQYQQPPPQPQAQQQGPALEGFLQKRGEDMGKPWLKRWFRLMPTGLLTYGKDQKTCTEKNVALMPHTQVRPLASKDATSEGQLMGTKKPFGFEIYSGNGVRTWFIDAGSQEKLQVWLWTLGRVINDLRMSAGAPNQWAPPGSGPAMAAPGSAGWYR